MELDVNPDPNLSREKRVLELCSVFSWVLLALAAFAFGGYLVFSGLYGTAASARVPIIIGYVGVLAAATLQVVFAAQASRRFPLVRGLRLKAIVGVAAPGVFGFIVAAVSSLAVQLFTAERDAIGANLLFGVTVLVCAPLVGFMFEAGRKLALAKQKFGPAGAVQLYDYQAALAQQDR